MRFRSLEKAEFLGIYLHFFRVGQSALFEGKNVLELKENIVENEFSGACNFFFPNVEKIIDQTADANGMKIDL